MIEQHKYEAMWSHPQYRKVAPGVACIPQFLLTAKPNKGETVRDLGCGTGRVGAALAEHGLNVTQYDFAENCRDPEIDLPFVLHDLTQPLSGTSDYAICTDVLEHIPPEDVTRVLWNVCTAARRVFLQISCTEDHMGALIDEPLHLTVESHDWWKEKLESLHVKVLWSEDQEHTCLFYVTAFADANDFADRSHINVPDEEIKNQVRANLAHKYEEAKPHLKQDREVMILAGGPSLADFEDEIRQKRESGMLLVTVNGTYNWCLERGITPSIQIMCDAREFNKRFVEPYVDKVRYLIASQCHPSVAESLPKDQVVMWHTYDCGVQEELGLKKLEDWFPIGGGSTVVLRSIVLLNMLGFNKLHLYGFDSCLRDEAHHAYEQKENDSSVVVEVNAAGKKFKCHPWMVVQANDFQKMVKLMGDHVEMAVYGDGLIAHIIHSAADSEIH